MRKLWLGLGAVFVASLLLGCGSGGGGGGSSGGGGAPSGPAAEVLPATFNFGTVTSSNTAAPLEVTVRNTGTAPLNVSSIGFTAGSSSVFTLNTNAGARPCGSATPVVAAGNSCTFRVAFQPGTTIGTFTATVRVSSNDSARANIDVPITGASEAPSRLTVRINQIENCPASNPATAYVSVTDQGGFPLLSLTAGNFTVRQGNPLSSNLLVGATLAGDRPVAIAAVLDNSGSITNQPVAYADMKNGFSTLFNGMRANDVGELINFGSEFEVTVPFPTPVSTANATNKSALVAGLSVPWTKGSDTRLYDSVYKAIDDTALQTPYRRAVIVATDGADDRAGLGVPASTRTLGEVISNAVAKKVPIFTIGIGSSIEASVLRDMAAETGGVFYQANTSQNLATIYQQLSSLLFQNQYALTFNQQPLAPGATSSVQVDVVSPTGITGVASRTMAGCN